MFVSRLIATGFFSGYGPVMPGTWGTIVGIVLWMLVFPFIRWEEASFLLVPAFFLGLLTTYQELATSHSADPSYVVIDEIVGVGVPLIYSFYSFDSTAVAVIVSFVTFRFFDISKIWPIGAIERYFESKPRFGQAWGVMLDDVVAGIMALAVIALGAQFL